MTSRIDDREDLAGYRISRGFTTERSEETGLTDVTLRWNITGPAGTAQAKLVLHTMPRVANVPAGSYEAAFWLGGEVALIEQMLKALRAG